MRLIDAGALVEFLLKEIIECDKEYDETSEHTILGAGQEAELIRDKVKEMPTIDIVRCKDCKYWAEAGREYNPNTNSWSAVMVCDYDECPEGCGHTCWSTNADDFCSRGEKK